MRHHWIERLVPLVAIVALVAGGLLADRHLAPAPAVQFGSSTVSPMPVVPSGTPLSSSWFCPGVPAGATPGSDGVISVLNPGDSAIEGTLTLYPIDGEPIARPLALPERSRSDFRMSQVAPGGWAAAVVELLGAEGVVEQTASSSAGFASSACANTAAQTWYLADGVTTLDASLSLLLFNPFPDDAIVDMSFATTSGTRQPGSLQGFVVKGRSLKVLPLDDVVRREPTIATTVKARSGRVVLGRAQSFVVGTRRAFAVGLGSTQASESWWFAAGESSSRTSERLALFNPGDDDSDVEVAFYPADPSKTQTPDPVDVTVPAAGSVTLDVNATDSVPDGDHSILVMAESGRPVVAERLLDVAGTKTANVTLQPGSPLTATAWTLLSGAAGNSESLAVANTTGEATTVTVRVLGPAGPTALEGLNGVTLGAAASLRVDLSAKGVKGAPVFVLSSLPVVAERLEGAPAGRTGVSIARGIPAEP